MAAAEPFIFRAGAGAAPTPEATTGGAGLEARIREVYRDLVPHAGAYVMLAKLRRALDGAARDEADAALVRDQGKHVIAIDS